MTSAVERGSLVLTFVLVACSGSTVAPERVAPSVVAASHPGELLGVERRRALRRLRALEPQVFDANTCLYDDDCEATTFLGCCHYDTPPGVAICPDCRWRPRNTLWIRREMARCRSLECGMPCVGENGTAPPAYCAVFETREGPRAECRLR